MNPIGKTIRHFLNFRGGASVGNTEQKASAVGKLLGQGRETAWIGLAAPNWTGRSYEQLVREGYRKNVIANRSVRIVAEAAAAVPLILYRGGERITRHPLLDLLGGPNPLQCGNELIEALFSYLQIAGNAYLEIVDDARGIPGELYILRPDRMKIVPGSSGWPIRFEYKVSGRTHAFPVDAKSGQSPIVHFRTFHPLDDFYGLTLLEACAFGIDIHNSAQSWNKSLLDNPALCIADYLVGIRVANSLTTSYDGQIIAGVGVDGARIDWANIIAEANSCDESVDLDAGGSENRYTCNGFIDPRRSHTENLEALASSMGGVVVFQGAKWRIYAAVSRAAVKSRDETHMLSGIEYRSKKSRSEKANAVRGVYADVSAEYQPRDIIPLINPTYVTEDGGDELWMDVNLSMTTSGTMAQRLAKIALERSRLDKMVSASFGPIALQDQAMDSITFSYTPLGLTDQKMRVADWQMQVANDENGNAGIVFPMTLIEEADAIYAWDETVDEQAIPAAATVTRVERCTNQTALPPVNVAGALTVVSSNPLTATDNGATAKITIASHTRHYGHANVSYNSGAITSLSFVTKYYVYCDDPGLKGGAVTYVATTLKTVVADDVNRIYVGEITTPADGGGGSGGGGGGGLLP